MNVGTQYKSTFCFVQQRRRVAEFCLPMETGGLQFQLNIKQFKHPRDAEKNVR